jgi:hypothetical protein
MYGLEFGVMVLGAFAPTISICNQENGMAEPRTAEEHEQLFSHIPNLPSFQKRACVQIDEMVQLQ